MARTSDDRERYRLLVAIALLLPTCFLSPVPIDETRYLAVAWNMHWSGEWLVPWIDGAAYPDKPPLLFWLVNAAWMVTGVHAWSARALEVLLALLTKPLLQRLAKELRVDAAGAAAAGWLWLGSLAFAIYAGAVMFDMLLCVCVLVAWLGGVWLVFGRTRTGTLLLALGLGLGLLAKGPVSLLVSGLPVLLGPWWYTPARGRALQLYSTTVLALLGAAALALTWAIPAALRGGPAYAHAIFLGQTTGRIAGSFSHDRGPFWYLLILPLFLLPWAVGLGRHMPTVYKRPRTPPLSDRFAIAATIPAFLVFCVISGKQPHYLLPLLPALAPAVGMRLADGRWKVVAWRVGVILLAIPLAAGAALAKLASQTPSSAYVCLVAAGLIGLALVLRGRQSFDTWAAAVAVIAVIALAKGGFLTGSAPRYSVEQAAQIVAADQQAGVPLLVAGEQRGMFTFAGRLTAPIPTAPDRQSVATWVHIHPDGQVISSYKDYNYTAIPLYRQPFFDRRLAIWRASDIAAEAAIQSAIQQHGRAGRRRD